MIAVSTFLRRAMYPAMSRANLFSRRIGAGEVGILTYHGVMPEGWVPGPGPVEASLVSADQFRRQLRFLKARYHLISPEDFRAWLTKGASLPPRAVLLTCDDGLLNVLAVMIPALLEEEIRCLFFVTGGSLEDREQYLWYDDLDRMLREAPLSTKQPAELWWRKVEALSAMNSDDRGKALVSLRGDLGLADRWSAGAAKKELCRLLSRPELQEVSRRGMSIGAHSLSHPILAKMPAELAESEIQASKTRLESCLQQEVWAFAYPFGHPGSAGTREMALAEKAGYACAFLNCGGGRLRRSSPRFGLPRAHVTSQMEMAELEAHLSGFHEALQRRFRCDGGVNRPCA